MPDNQKRLLIVYDVAYPFVKGGAQRRFFEIASRLSDRGWTVDWLTFKFWPGPSVTKQGPITYISIGEPPEFYNSSGNRNILEPLIFAARFARRISMLRHYDVVWLGQWPILHVLPALLFLIFFRTTVVIDWWEVWGRKVWCKYSRRAGFIGYVVEALTLWASAKRGVIVTDSKLEQARIKAHVGDRAPVYFAPNGVSRDIIGAVDVHRPAEFDIVSFGRLKNHKRVDLLLHALRTMKLSFGLTARVAIVGDGPERENLERLARDTGIDSQVRFFGTIPDAASMYEVLKRSAICVNTTMGGGGGNLSIFEANASGLPVVAFKAEDGIDIELIEHGKSGIIVSPPDSQELARHLTFLLRNPDQLLRMKEYSFTRSFQFDWGTTSHFYEQVFTGRVGGC